mmetsp:Transcript_4571/g.11497  ORF Transcript_4571/g.11497 Transcript_4571/m.11497 type:complete len:109 (+) Transcript_4571:116-442(+)
MPSRLHANLTKYSKLEMLDVHDCSPGAALLAVRWWLHVVVPVVRRQHPLRSKVKVVTGHGKTRAVWQTRNMKDRVCIEFDKMGAPWRMDCGADAPVHLGCFEIEARRL